MEIREIEDKKIWDGFFAEQKEKTFLQSFDWGEFNIEMGNKIWRLGLFEKERIVSLFLVSKIKAKRGTFLLGQHGPAFLQSFSKKEILGLILSELKRIGKSEKADFVRINPLWERSEENEKIMEDLGFRKSPMHANSYESTWKLDITPSEEEIMNGMRKTTRYLIRQTSKNSDISIEKSSRVEDIGLYQELNKAVAKRHNFVSFPLDFVKKEFKVFSENGNALLFFGNYKGKIAAASLVIFWSGSAYYHQAASDSRYSKLSMPYLLQWEAIKEAKKRGCGTYDFWGYVDPKKNPKHPWAGPTLFKMGFGGRGYEYLRTYDYPLSWKYFFINIFENLRKMKRGL
jgi:lipid II:glycine glycyltransferase (peptidoglycan interpeptide bridge formation enzyme)